MVDSESNLGRIAELTGRSTDWADTMVIDRRGGTPDSAMTTLGLHRLVDHGRCYEVSTVRGLTEVAASDSAIDLESTVSNTSNRTPPPHATISAAWDDQAVVDSHAENVLGDNVTFRVAGDQTEVDIPVIDATPEGLGYYGALLIVEGSIVRFPNRYPIWQMDLGEGYVDGFLMTPAGNGFYLEYHHDRPHWHQPLNPESGGYYLLAKDAGPGPSGVTQYQVTGFFIPHGTAVYTGLGSIHCDAALTGRNWLVGYDESEDYSTAVVRNEAGAFVKLSGKRPTGFLSARSRLGHSGSQDSRPGTEPETDNQAHFGRGDPS